MKITMAKNPAYAQRGKDAIGFEFSGCGFACVCQDHACSILPAFKDPVKNIRPVNVFFKRFDTAGH